MVDTSKAKDALREAAKTGKKWTIRIVVATVLFAIAGSVLYVLFALNFAYSKGDHVGRVQRLSKRGWLCKTNEGELDQAVVAGQNLQTWAFTVPDDKVVEQINSFAGHRVELHYEEHKGLPSTCYGETPFFVTGVKRVD